MIPHKLAIFQAPATINTIPIIVLAFISLLFVVQRFWVQSSCKPNAMELAPIAEAPPSFAVSAAKLRRII
jgi:hypothetical protein